MDSSLSAGHLNNSSSKMKYSFPKSDRFGSKRYESASPDTFYQLPEIKSKRATGFGYGNKLDISKQNVRTPAPDVYKMHSSFDLPKNHGITMALGREKIRQGDMFQEHFKKPSPSEYNPEKLKKSLSYSISQKHNDLSDRWVRSVPGPGAYSCQKLANKDLKISVSKHISAPSTRFGKDQRLTQAQIFDPKTPGSNQYNNDILIAKKFHQKSGNRFSNGIRPPMANTNPIPGPGAYNRMSDFG